LKKILVTGFNGFIGSNLVESLQKKYRIVGLSNQLKNKFKIQQIRGDVRKITIDKIPDDIFCIIHLAALTDVRYCEHNPTKCFDVNFNGTQNMIEIARKTKSKFILLSTSHVYGKPQTLPIRETHHTNPTSIYAASKLAAELVSKSYSLAYGMDVSIIRLFSVFGPESPEHLVTTKLFSQSLKGNIIRLGNLTSRRDFVYINDVIKAIETIMKKSKGFEIYNVGTEKSHSIKEVCELLKKITKNEFSIKSSKSLKRKAEVPNIIADCSKLKKLGWKPQTNLVKGLKLTFDWYNTTI